MGRTEGATGAVEAMDPRRPAPAPAARAASAASRCGAWSHVLHRAARDAARGPATSRRAAVTSQPTCDLDVVRFRRSQRLFLSREGSSFPPWKEQHNAFAR